MKNMVIMEMLKSKYNHFRNCQLYFYRDSNEREVDLLLDYGSRIDAIEIKSTQTFDKSFLKQLNHLREIMPVKTGNTFVCYTGETEMNVGNSRLVNFRNIFRI
jgi:hypothetical protein